jgi:hypothetical protein
MKAGTPMTDADTREALKRIEILLTAILGIQVDQFLRDSDVAKPRPRSIDRMLTDFGFNQVQVATLLGKSPQAVGQVLAKDKSKRTSNKGQE